MPSPLVYRQPAKANHAQLYEILVKELTDFVLFLMDPDGCIVSWNPGVERVLGYTEAEWLDQPASMIFTPEDRAQGKPQEEMAQAATEGRAPDIRWHLRKDGERLYVEGTLVALRDDAGQLLGFSKVMRDVTQRQRNEERSAFLVRLDNALRPLSDPDDIPPTASRLLGEHLQVDRCGYCTFASDQNTFDLTSVSLRPEMPSIAGRFTLTQFGHAATELFRSNRPIVIEDTESDPGTADAEAAYGQIGIRAHASVPFHKGGRLFAAIGLHQLTPRKWRPDELDLVQLVANRCWESLERMQAEAALRDSEQRLGRVLDAGELGAWELDLATQQAWRSQQHDQIFGYQTLLPEWTYQQFLEHVLPEDRGAVDQQFQQAVAKGETWSFECRIRRADRVERWIWAQGKIELDAAGQPLRMKGMVRDITERKRVEEELRQSHRELEEFAYVASHDLQEPLRMVNIYTQLLLKRLPGENPELSEYAEFVRQGVTRMEVLIRDLLTYSRMVHDEPLPVGAADLSVSLREAISMLQSRMEESGAAITACPLPTVRGDTKQMAQVFQNLLSNALKYRRPEVPPEIHISVEPNGTQWVCAVRDNGIGFEPQYAERIFGLFKRLHKDEYPGTGLGLAICQRIIERYGGRLWAEGRPGKGATFFFALPRSEGN